MSERRCRPANENEARRQLRGRRSRNVLGGQQTPDPVTEGPAWSPKTTNRPKFRFFSSSAHIDHCVCSNPTMGRRLGTEGSSPFSQSLLTRCVFKTLSQDVPSATKCLPTHLVPSQAPPAVNVVMLAALVSHRNTLRASLSLKQTDNSISFPMKHSHALLQASCFLCDQDPCRARLKSEDFQTHETQLSTQTKLYY